MVTFAIMNTLEIDALSFVYIYTIYGMLIYCMHVGVHMCTSKCGYACMWTTETDIRCFHNFYPPCMTMQSLLLTLVLTVSASLASQLAHGIAYLFLEHTGIIVEPIPTYLSWGWS